MPAADLLVIVPTRGRLAKLQRFLEVADATCEAATELMVVIDDDDRGSYHGLQLPDRARAVYGPRATLGPKLNRWAVPAACVYPVVGFLADDTEPETPGWDRLLLDALDTPGVAYPANGRRDDVPEHQFISAGIVRALGWFFEPSLCHYWTDNVWADLGNGAGCLRYVPEAMVWHHHYTLGDRWAGRDKTYAEAETNGVRDQQAYQAWRRDRMAADVATVRSVIEGE